MISKFNEAVKQATLHCYPQQDSNSKVQECIDRFESSDNFKKFKEQFKGEFENWEAAYKAKTVEDGQHELSADDHKIINEQKENMISKFNEEVKQATLYCHRH